MPQKYCRGKNEVWMNHRRTRKLLKLCSCVDAYRPSNEQEIFEKDAQQTAKHDHQVSLKAAVLSRY